MKQLCWNCKNTNRFKCSWFEEDAKLPDCVELKNNIIVKCRNFIPEVYKQMSNKEIASILNVNIRTFYRYKQKYLKLFHRLYDTPLP